MPELPEVTTMVNGLRELILNKTIINVWTNREKLIKNINFFDFRKSIIGAKIVDIFRKGKVVSFQLNNKKILFVHPKMSGHFLVGKWRQVGGVWLSDDNKVLKYVHLIFWLDDSSMIAFSDLRQFARIELWDMKKISDAEIIQKLGVDALEITFSQFKKITENSRKKIKQLLMDQKLIAGVGNIYADEILFRAKIHPFRLAKNLTGQEIKRIHSLIYPILEKAINLGGSSISDFFHTNGESGTFQKEIRVYRRNGKKCLTCGTIIKKQKMASRSTYFCPKCQK